MNKISKIFGAVAVAGVIAAGSAAFTAGGLRTDGQAAADQFIGGTVSQSVSGATLTNVAYTFSDPITKRDVSAITLTFVEDMTDLDVAVTPTGSGLTAFTCTTDGSVDEQVNCIGGTASDLTSLAVAVTKS
jgi:hypothetical protein